MNQFRFVVVLLLLLSSPAFAYTAHISAPAVISDIDRGVLTQIYANVTAGNGTITVSAMGGTVGNDTVQSADTAVAYAMSYLKLDESMYNVNFTIESESSNISGPSAGLAFTLITISALKHEPLSPNFTVTGTINSSGGVGPVGGVFNKVQAAKLGGSRFILVPYVDNSSFQYTLYYLSQQTYGIPVKEVKNVQQAIEYAFGGVLPAYLDYNITTDYHPSLLPNASDACQSCNFSTFRGLVNMTFNLTSQEIGAINGSRFGSAKSQLSSQLSQYRVLAAKGYLYTGADLAFVEYPTAFVFANYRNSNSSTASGILYNISAYCNMSGIEPQLTDLNYEYVISAEARRSWAQITLAQAYGDLNASQTSDDVLESLYSAAPAYSWCAASSYLFNASSAIGGNYVSLSPRLGASAESGYLHAKGKFGTAGLYMQAANYSIANGYYGAALYSLDYAGVFYSGKADLVYNSTTANYTSSLVSNAISQGRVWPVQFGIQSSFYLGEASMNSKDNALASGYLDNAYATALLALNLSKLDSNLQGSFVLTTNSSAQQAAAALAQISSSITLITYVLIMVLILLFALLIAFILHILEHRPKSGRR